MRSWISNVQDSIDEMAARRNIKKCRHTADVKALDLLLVY
jgi:hypothetical protein